MSYDPTYDYRLRRASRDREHFDLVAKLYERASLKRWRAVVPFNRKKRKKVPVKGMIIGGRLMLSKESS